jgi:GH24 family phage-related lysozyme (muramidase)
MEQQEVRANRRSANHNFPTSGFSANWSGLPNPFFPETQSMASPRKPIFDTMRAILKRGFHQSEVEALDRALDQSTEFLPQDRVTCGPSVPHIRRTDRAKSAAERTIGPRGIALIKRFEGCARLRTDGLIEAYPDPGTGCDPWTIGWGATGAGIEPGTVWTQAQCDARLRDDLKRYAADVARAIGDAPTTQAQFDAMVSFHYNTGAIGRATLTKKHVAGDHIAALAEFARWNKAGGRVLKGLVRRRAEEAALYADQ